jgi:molybdopterin/thiamine biosynthesis adenylyltransferase
MQETPRYARQVAFPAVGAAGQERLAAATAVVIGVGATGSVIASILARAGVGRLRIVDRDIVELQNLQRQPLFDEDDARAAAPKAVAAARALSRANSSIAIEPHVADLAPRNAERLLDGAACVLDGTDNFQTRLLINDWCVARRVPWVYAGVIASYGHTMTIVPGRTACFRCYVGEAPPPGSVDTCETAGVIAPAVHVVGAMAAAEGLKLLAGKSAEARPGLFTIDVWTGSARTIQVPADPDCPCCARGALDFLRATDADGAAALCGRDAVQVRPPAGGAVLDLPGLATRLRATGDGEVATWGDAAVRFKASGLDATFFADGRAIVKGTGDVGRARAFYARYVGV